MKDKELEKIRELTNGDSFGELSLSEATSTRKFNAVALEDSQMATLDKKSFMRAFESIRSQISKQVDDLQKNSLFNNDWSNLTLMGMAFTFNVMEVKKDTFLYREGDIATEVYFLRSGQVECSRKLPLTQKDQDDEYQISPRRLKWAHISLWTDFALFGYEEFYRINVLEADNVLKTIVKREVNVEVISEKAEIWSMNAQVIALFPSNPLEIF